MIYAIDQKTPTQGLLKATPSQFETICNRVIALGKVIQVKQVVLLSLRLPYSNVRILFRM